MFIAGLSRHKFCA